MHKFLVLMVLLGLSACGSQSSGGNGNFAAFATGPISQACEKSPRDAANRRLCGCIQAAADRTLSDSDQRRAAQFFTDPQKAQDVKAQDGAAADAFWRRYREFASNAETLCR